MILKKKELIQELNRKIKNNLFKLDTMLDLMWTDEYQDSDELQQEYEILLAETELLQNEYFQVCQELDDIDKVV